ncbi:MAG: hypothetical protein EPO35_04675 [Acidobacteria bacterium]|nr:MAG: hypothetical protein EPO35_04675 [Acidobacteriota bacterium]
MNYTRSLVAVLMIAAASAGCGSSSGLSPVEPSTSTGTSAQLVPPTAFLVASQRINADSNTLTFTWGSSESSFQLVIGTASGSTNVLSQTVIGNTFAWTSPRAAGTYYARVAAKRGDSTSAFSDEQILTIVDVRNIIEAMFFHTGPMSDATEGAGSNPLAGIWADGTRLRVQVSTDAGGTARANAQTFADQYAALVGGAITATAEMTSDRMQSSAQRPELSLPEFTIGIRVQTGVCTTGALACANYGPAPLGQNRAMITLALSGGLNVSATAHEMGHAYGMGHIQTPAAGRPEFRFMMNSNSGAEQMTDAEKLAVTLARNGGLRAGMTRAQAFGLGLINQ